MEEKIKLPTDIILDDDIIEEIDTNPAVKYIISMARELFIPLWHKKSRKILGINKMISEDLLGENPIKVSRTKKEKNSITPEEFLSLFSEIDEDKVDFGKIGMLNLKKEARYFSDNLSEALLKSFYSGNWIMGPEVNAFEEEVKKLLGVKYAVGVNSGTDALVIALRSIALSKFKKEFFSEDDEVIVPDLTFLATVEAVILSGAKPVIANVDERTYTISPESIEKSVTKKTKGIVVVHLYGLPCDMKAISDIAKKYNLFIVEDCAQSFYSRFDGKYTGTIGDVGCFSFFPSKNLGGHGDGGLITTNDENIFFYAEILRKHGAKIRDYSEHIGMNSRLDTIQAALLLKKIKFIDFLTERRRKIAGIYTSILKESKRIITPYEPENRFHVFHQYTIRVKGGSEELQKFLSKNNIETRKYYPYPMHKLPAVKCKIYDNLYTESIIKEILSLPIEPLHPDILIKYVGNKIMEFMGKSE